MIMQSYDFYTLYQKYGRNMEFGGDDQWSNMLGGTELIRRKLRKRRLRYDYQPSFKFRRQKMGKHSPAQYGLILRKLLHSTSPVLEKRCRL